MDSKGLVNPGLDHPPLCIGEGERESDMDPLESSGTCKYGWVEPGAVSPDVALPFCFAQSGLSNDTIDVALALEERRRW